MDINWENEGAEAVERLREMIRFDTVNPPGNEQTLVEWLAAQLRAEGLTPEVIVVEGERANRAAAIIDVASRRGTGGRG